MISLSNFIIDLMILFENIYIIQMIVNVII